MAIDIKNLSAKELFELAQKKEQEEAEETALKEQIKQLKDKRESLVQDHTANLANIEDQIQMLNAERDTLNKQHSEQLAQLDKEIAELSGEEAEPAKPAAPPAQKKPATAPATPPRAAASKPSIAVNDELAGRILEIMRKRPSISDSLLKEQLKGQGFSVASLPRVLDQLEKEKRIINKGGGNYALSKKY